MNKVFLLLVPPVILTFAVPALPMKKIGGKAVTIYEAEVGKRDGKKIEIKVAEDGKLIKVKDD